MNTCPIYRRSGGYSYNASVPGPIGSILSPGTDLKKYSSLPFASTLCGSCSDVCPVRINIHEQLYFWRQEIVQAGNVSVMQRLTMKLTGIVMRYPRVYRIISRLAGYIPPRVFNLIKNPWTRQRDLPVMPPLTFRAWFEKNRTK
jgi:L-lactate dehydrogenase complex protein LldF